MSADNPNDVTENKNVATQLRELRNRADQQPVSYKMLFDEAMDIADGQFRRAIHAEAKIHVMTAPSDPVQEPEAVALKPCPFCGSKTGPIYYDGGDDDFVVTCKDCGASSAYSDDRNNPIRWWNTRPALDREAVARIIEPQAFSSEEFISIDEARSRDKAIAKADAIIALIEGRT